MLKYKMIFDMRYGVPYGVPYGIPCGWKVFSLRSRPFVALPDLAEGVRREDISGPKTSPDMILNSFDVKFHGLSIQPKPTQVEGLWDTSDGVLFDFRHDQTN